MRDYESVLVDFFKKVDAGIPVDPEEVIRANSEHASRLRRFFRNAGELDRLITQADDATNASGSGAVQIDKVIGGFRIVREIGRGGMGVVYEAEQLRMERRVALKVLQWNAALDVGKRKRFANEVQAVGTLEHDHIVPVYAVGEHEGICFYAMKLIDGTTLGGFTERKRRDLLEYRPIVLVKWVRFESERLGKLDSSKVRWATAFAGNCQVSCEGCRRHRTCPPTWDRASRHQAVQFVDRS